MNKKYLYSGLLLGVIVLGAVSVWLAVRVTEVRQMVHYHANLAIYVEGERFDMSEDQYMEDIGACASASIMSPRDRVHFHENNMDTVHVHAGGVSWGHLLTNVGFYFTESQIVLPTGKMYENTEGKKWYFVLNGKQLMNDPFNTQIQSEDQLLIAYEEAENAKEILAREYATVSDNAHEYNGKYDPGSCQSNVSQNPFVKFFVEHLGEEGHEMHE